MTTYRRAVFVLTVVLQALLITRPSAARVVDVFPGPGAPLQSAIDAAEPGDQLRLRGVFAEAVVVTKPLTLRAGPRRGWSEAIDSGCAAAVGLKIAADRVRVKGVGVAGGAQAAIQVENADHVDIAAWVHDACSTTLYGIDVVGSTRIRIRRSMIDGPVRDALVRVLSAPAAANVLVARTGMHDARMGILV